MGENFEDLVAKICHFVINDVTRMDFWEFVVMSQKEWK